MTSTRYNVVFHDGRFNLNDQVNDVTLRSTGKRRAGYRALTAFAKAMNKRADDKDVMESICAATMSAVSALSVDPRSEYSNAEHCLIKAILADKWHARPRKEWERISNALDRDYLANFAPDRLDKAWRRLVSDRFVSSYTEDGTRWYELNLKESEG